MKTQRFQYMLALLALLFLDGRWHMPNQNPTTSPNTLKAALGSRPLPKLGEGRVFISPEAEKALLISSVPDLEKDFIGKQLAIWSHLNLVELAPKVNGSATLQLREQKQIQDWLYSGTNVNMEAWLDFLSVTHITAPGQVVIYTNRPTALPLLRLAPPILSETPGLTNTLSLDPKKESLFAGFLTPRSGAGDVKDVRIREHEISATISAEQPNTGVIIAQSWHPAWRAEINGVPHQWYWGGGLARVNHAFQGLAVPVGESKIRIYYRDVWFIGGTTVSLLTMLMLFVPHLRRRLAARP